MIKYECWWPGCEYCTNSRSKIDFHHVTPKEINPHKNNKVTIPLCKTHHAMIYHPEAKTGQHSIKCDDSLKITMVTTSTNGKVVLYEDMNGKGISYFTKTKEVFYD